MYISDILNKKNPPKGLFHIYKNFYNVGSAEINLIQLIYKNDIIIDVEPVEFHSFLIEVSDNVQYGNSFSAVAKSLNCISVLRQAAYTLDKLLVKSI